MTDITYTSSDGTAYDLMADMSLRIKEAKFHAFSWVPEVTEKKYGERVDKWKKEAWVQPAVISLRGTKKARKKKLDAFHASIERDMFYNSPGTLQWDDWYIRCFIRSSDVYPSEENDFTTYNEVELYCPTPLWVSEQDYTIDAVTESVLSDTDINYNLSYGYPYSYQAAYDTSKAINIEHYAPCDFRLKLYGPQDNLNITMGNVSLQVDYAIPDGAYMVIDTRETVDADKHCYLVAGGTETNCFNYRDPETSLLEKVEPGTVTVTYNRETQLDLTVYKERSEPAWL